MLFRSKVTKNVVSMVRNEDDPEKTTPVRLSIYEDIRKLVRDPYDVVKSSM